MSTRQIVRHGNADQSPAFDTRTLAQAFGQVAPTKPPATGAGLQHKTGKDGSPKVKPTKGGTET